MKKSPQRVAVNQQFYLKKLHTESCKASLT